MKPDEQKPAAAEFEPLDKVEDDIRKRLTDEAVEKRITAIFDAAKTDVAKYGESLALWQVAGDGAGPAPVAPDVKKMAEDSVAKIKSGEFHPFTGPITDNEGRAVLAAGAVMTDEQILSMNFLVSGVQGKASK